MASSQPLPSSLAPNQDGLKWEIDMFELTPCWSKEPSKDVISQIARKHVPHSAQSHVIVDLHGEGLFNKVYKISVSGHDYVIRVSLPVCPRLKTESEVATINYVRQHTNIPVPLIHAFDANNQNELEFEWILMEMMPGTTLDTKWRLMSEEARISLVKELAFFQSQLFRASFSGIGSIYPKDHQEHQTPVGTTQKAYTAVELGEMVSTPFFWGPYYKYDANRGPYHNSLQWLQARLQFYSIEMQHASDNSDDPWVREEARQVHNLVNDIAHELSGVFPIHSASSEASVLFHNDLNMQNILVDENRKLTAIIDWECTATIPLWHACRVPKLLTGPYCDVKPERHRYKPEHPGDEDDILFRDGRGNEGIDSSYWRQLLIYEKSELRKVFMEEMEVQCPEWATIAQASLAKADFESAVDGCGEQILRGRVIRWSLAYKAGNGYSLTEDLAQY